MTSKSKRALLEPMSPMSPASPYTPRTPLLAYDQESLMWECVYDAASGQYFFSNKITGETTWDPPESMKEVYENLPQVKALKGLSKGFHRAALVIQGVIRARRLRRNPKPLYDKHLDVNTGRFYYRQTKTGETTWDTPTGTFPLAKPPADRTAGLLLEKSIRDEKRRLAGVERRRLIQLRKEEFHREQRARKSGLERAAEVHGLEVWNEAFRLAVASGELKICWQKLGDFHEDVPRFEQRFGKPLQAVRMVGHDLKRLPPEFGDTSLRSLTSLSLASNQLDCLPDSVCKLTRLRSLNLLRNRLTSLPHKFGNLTNLETLLINSNRLESLPMSIGNLSRLDRLECSSNKLTKLPDSVGRLRCHTLSANGNLITSLTPSVCDMPNLRWLALCDNRLEFLPRELGECAKLERLHLLGNNLQDLPETLGQLTPLRELWLGQNLRLSALPESFHCLTNLRSLNMEMCPSMVYPPLQYLVRGVPEVLKWSEARVSHSQHLRRQRIVDRLGNLFEQLKEQAPYFGKRVKAFFEPDVFHEDEYWYALALPVHNHVAFKCSPKKLAKLLDQEERLKARKRAKSAAVKGTEAAAAEDEESDQAAMARPGGLDEESLRRVCEKVLGWLPKREKGGDAGLAVKKKFQREADAFEALQGSKIMGALGGAKDAVEKDEAHALAQKRADLEAAARRKNQEELELEECGPVSETLVVGEVVEGSSAAAAGLQAGQRLLSVGGLELETFTELVAELVKRCKDNLTETDPEAAEEEAAADERQRLRGKKPKNRGPVLPRDVEVRMELSGGRTGLFWDKLLPALEGYWEAGRESEFVGQDDGGGGGGSSEDGEQQPHKYLHVPKKYVQQYSYDKEEVDRVLASFKDPWGPVCVEVQECLFRRCGCVDGKGKRRVCVPPAPGFMCTRPALLLKVEVKLQRQKDAFDERVRQDAEMQAVEDLARKTAQAWAATEEGRKYLKELAEKTTGRVVEQRKEERSQGTLNEAAQRKVGQLERRFESEKQKLEKARDRREEGINASIADLEAEVRTASGLARDLKEKQMDGLTAQLTQGLPEDELLQTLRDKHGAQVEAAIAELDAKAAAKSSAHASSGWGGGGGGGGGLFKGAEYRKVREELMLDVVRQYCEREVKKAREGKQREVDNLNKIKRAWGGVGVADSFKAWRKATRLNVNTRYREEARLKRDGFNSAQTPLAAIKLARWKMKQWGEPSVDLWSDELYWTHQKSGTIRWSEPTTVEFFPKGYKMPKQYQGLSDEDLDGLRIRNKVFEDVEVPYQDEELSGSDSSSDGSDETDDSESDDSEDSDSDSNEDDGDEGEDSANAGGGQGLSTAASSGPGTTATTSRTSGGSSGGSDESSNSDDDESEEEEEEEVQEMGPDGVMVTVTVKKKKKKDAEDEIRPKTPMPVLEAQERSLDEAEASLKRMRERYTARQAKAREFRESELAKSERAAIAAEARAEALKNKDLTTTQVSGSSMGGAGGAGRKAKSSALIEDGDDGNGAEEVTTRDGLVDPVFDPSKADEYSEEELTAMALEQVKRNASQGLDADGNPVKGLF